MRGTFVALLTGAALASSPLQAGVIVSFVEPERYTDATDSAHSLKQTLSQVEGVLKGLADRHLPAKEMLRIEVLDIDLAGRAWLHPRNDTRIIDGVADWPRFEVRYTLEAGGRVSEPVRETLSDKTFRMAPELRRSTETLAFEKRLLEDWFKERFVDRKPPRAGAAEAR